VGKRGWCSVLSSLVASRLSVTVAVYVCEHGWVGDVVGLVFVSDIVFVAGFVLYFVAVAVL